MDWPGHLMPQIPIECHSNVNLCPVFYLKAYLCHQSLFGRGQMDLGCLKYVGSGQSVQQP